MLVEMNDCTFGYIPGRPIVRLQGTVRLGRGESLGVYGPNGSGKTTLVRGLLGLLPPMSGVLRRDSAARPGYLPQHRGIDLGWPMSARDAATLASSARQRFGWAHGCRDRVKRSMDVLQVSELAEKRFATLSGGQQQRVLLAGALADEPALLVLDEPTDGLDAGSRSLFLRVLGEAIQSGLAAVVVSHDLLDLIALCETALWVVAAPDPEAAGVAHVVPAADLERLHEKGWSL